MKSLQQRLALLLVTCSLIVSLLTSGRIGYHRASSSAPTIFEHYRHVHSNLNIDDIYVIKTALFAGFARDSGSAASGSKGKKAPSSRKPDDAVVSGPSASDTCSCFSGKTYGECCEPVHKAPAQATPSAILRARYVAFKYGLSDFIITTSSPKCEDYVKYLVESQASLKSGTKRWAREIIQLSKTEIDYLKFEIVKETLSKDGRTSELVFRAAFEDKEGRVFAVQEETVFVKSAQGNMWLYESGVTSALDEDEVDAMVKSLGDRVKPASKGSTGAAGSNAGVAGALKPLKNRPPVYDDDKNKLQAMPLGRA
jgi:uncharacterized protein YchJ